MIFADFTKTVKKSHKIKRRQTLDAIPDCGPVQLKIDHSSSAGPSVPYSTAFEMLYAYFVVA